MVKTLKVQAQRIIVPVWEIKKYQNNNKHHWEKQIEALKSSIERFSYIDEIVIDKNNTIILWHGRFDAILDMWYQEVKVKKLDISVEDEKALRYLHNRLSEYDVSYNVDNLKYELQNWVDFSLWGLSEDEFLWWIDISDFSQKETGQINWNSAKTYESQQDEVDDIDDILNEIDDLEIPETNTSVMRWVQIPVKVENYDKVFSEFSKAIKNNTNIWEVFLQELKSINQSNLWN